MAVCHLVPDGNRAPPIKPTLPADGRAFQPVWGFYTGYTRYIGCSISPLSQPTRRGAALLRLLRRVMVIATSHAQRPLTQILSRVKSVVHRLPDWVNVA